MSKRTLVSYSSTSSSCVSMLPGGMSHVMFASSKSFSYVTGLGAGKVDSSFVRELSWIFTSIFVAILQTSVIALTPFFGRIEG